MINLLPSNQKEENLSEERLRLVCILGITLAISLFSFTLILFAVKTIIYGQLESQRIILGQKERSLEISDFHKTEKAIKNYNLLLKQLDAFYRENYGLIEILEKIYQAMPQGTFLRNFSFNRSKSQITFSGFCPTRDNLLELKENLEKEEIFEGVYFPPSNWVKPHDIDFSVSFEIKK